MVTAYINKEFARIQAEESDKINRQEKSEGIEKAIIDQLVLDPKSTRKQLASLLNVSEQTVRYRLEKLQHEGKIQRKGSTKSGEMGSEQVAVNTIVIKSKQKLRSITLFVF